MGSLCTGEEGRGRFWLHLGSLFQMHVNPLTVQEQHTCPSMLPPFPVTPEQGSRPNFAGMQQHADLAWLFGGAAIPLTLLAQWARAAMANTGSIHDAQAPVGFSAVLMGDEFLLSRAPQCPIRLKSKVLT